jgi:hypothetical protein
LRPETHCSQGGLNGPPLQGWKAGVQSSEFLKGKKGILDSQMNYLSLGLAALGGTVVYFAFGFLMVWLVPALIDESRKYPDVFRSKEKSWP